jgi:hypothetical protein
MALGIMRLGLIDNTSANPMDKEDGITIKRQRSQQLRGSAIHAITAPFPYRQYDGPSANSFV